MLFFLGLIEVIIFIGKLTILKQVAVISAGAEMSPDQ